MTPPMLATRDEPDTAMPPADATTAWLMCRAGSMLCALPVDQVGETMRALPLEPFAAAPRYVLGLSIIRGVPVPVVDVGLIVGGAPTQAVRFVTIKTADRTVAVAFSRVIGISSIAADMSGQLPPLLDNAATETVAAVGARDAELLVFLRASRLVPEDVFAALDARTTLS
jgi:purine-binding chemotaxis protein CheW